jgi:YidC/Oxa1 family membrane protein insertase
MEDRQQRLLLSVILSLGIWFVAQYFLFPPSPPKKNPVKEVAKETVDSKEAKDSKVAKEVPKKVELKAINQQDIKKFYIETSSYLVQFSSLGGRIQKLF